MANKTALEYTDQLLRYVTRNNEPFGDKPFVGLGDFRHVAPVVRAGGPLSVLSCSVIFVAILSVSTRLWRFRVLTVGGLHSRKESFTASFAS